GGPEDDWVACDVRLFGRQGAHLVEAYTPERTTRAEAGREVLRRPHPGRRGQQGRGRGRLLVRPARPVRSRERLERKAAGVARRGRNVARERAGQRRVE